MGIPRNPDYNGKSQDGVGYFQRAIKNGRRVSSARAFLHPAMGRQNLQVITHAHATQILFEDKRAVGVEYDRQGTRKIVRVRREVILSGGVVASPQLLQISGIGDPQHLSQIGVEVRHALKGVGQNLRDHYAVRMVARVQNTWTINQKAKGLPLLGEIAKYFTGQTSILGLCPSLVHCFWKSHEAVSGNDLQMTFTPASYKEGVQSQLDDFPGVTCAPWQQRPESKGHLLARSANPFEAPEIQPNYLSYPMDRQVLLGGMRLARRLLQTPAMMRYFVQEEFPGADAQSDDELLAFAKERGTTTFHLMGTCRMAPITDPTAVVDDQLRVHGLEGLRVADASIMPMMLSANLNAATLMIGEKAADMILGKAAPEAVVLREVA